MNRFRYAVTSAFLVFAFLVTETISSSANPTASKYDVVIYGGSPSAVAAAISARRAGHTAVILSERPTIGGAISNGLGATDVRGKIAITGISREFFKSVQSHYKDKNVWNVEPSVAESIFRKMLREAKVPWIADVQIKSVTVLDGKIRCATLARKKQYCGSIFVDASYTNDLTDLAGAQTTLGPADLYAYDEREAHNRHFYLVGDFSKFPQGVVDQAVRQNPYIASVSASPSPTTASGTSDSLTQGTPSWNYRLCISKQNMRPFMRRAGYETYLPSWRVLVKAIYGLKLYQPGSPLHPKELGRTPLVRMVDIGNGKFDLNAGNAQISNVPIPREYFTNPETRTAAETKLRNYLESFLYFVQNDKSVPAIERQSLKGFGLCADEFVDNGNWPYAPYIREGRRLVGKATLTTNEIIRSRVSDESIAVASYYLDSKSAQIVSFNGAVYRDIGRYIKPPMYEIPYSTLVPKEGPSNLLVSVNISASPTAYGSVRMEPQLMMIGQAAGEAASLALESGKAVSQINITSLKRRLWKVGMITNIRVICRELSPAVRTKWLFDPETCQPITSN